MTRKKFVIALCVLICILLVTVLVKCHSDKYEIIYLEEPDPSFYPSFYDFVMICFSESTLGLKVDPITDYKDAVEKGVGLLETHWHKKGVYQIYGDNITVFYIPKEDAWVIIGDPPYDVTESGPSGTRGQPVVIIQPDGTVLAIGTI